MVGKTDLYIIYMFQSIFRRILEEGMNAVGLLLQVSEAKLNSRYFYE